MRKGITLSTLAVCIVGAVGATTAAEVRTTYSGLNCVQDWHGDEQYEPGYLRDNPDGYDALCPLDRVGSDVTGSIKDVKIVVSDRSIDDEVACFTRSCNPDATVCAVSDTDSTTNAFTGKDTLSMGDVTAYNYGSAYVHCQGKTDIYSYRATD